jgi:hypothetical protein
MLDKYSGIGTQGIGKYKHNRNVISFNNISDSINEGDTLFKAQT